MKKAWGRDSSYDLYNMNTDCYDTSGRKRLFLLKRVVQFGTAGVLLLAILGLSGINNPTGEAVRSKLSYYLTDEGSNMMPAIKNFARAGAWSDTFDKGILKVFGNIDIPASQQAKPVTIPVSGTIIRTYGWETSGDGQKLLHPGIDIAAADPSAPVHAALEGSVRYIGKNQRLGTYLELDHGGGMVTVYGNCGEVIVVEGQEVQGGETIARLKNEAQPFVHFEIRVNGKATDPLNSISGAGTDT